MTFIIASLVILIGFTVFSFIIGNILLVIFFAIPLTAKLNKKSLLKPKSSSGYDVSASYIVALFTQVAILFLVTMFFYVFFQDSFFISLVIGYTIGMIAILIKIKSFGMNRDNFFEYFEKNEDAFWEELSDSYHENREDLFKYIQDVI